MKVRVFRSQEVRINGRLYRVQEGVQELEEHVAELLMNLSLAERVEEKTDDKRARGKRVSQAS